ncbi:unnamed protein product [Sphenostylis stenocarpa]|uniref:Uncharacterized protein n=1 Tax=Sphenostylis stenocarpa TaxID=92480 RepID=A0AA86VDU6_9FABA|nr:unnamed protein product [Sphenostylis stenocarpa]
MQQSVGDDLMRLFWRLWLEYDKDGLVDLTVAKRAVIMATHTRWSLHVLAEVISWLILRLVQKMSSAKTVGFGNGYLTFTVCMWVSRFSCKSLGKISGYISQMSDVWFEGLLHGELKVMKDLGGTYGRPGQGSK